MHVLLTLAFAAGVLLTFLSLTEDQKHGGQAPASTLRVPGWLARRAGELGVEAHEFVLVSAAAALGGGLAAQLVLGWPVVTLAAAAAGSLLPLGYLGQRAERRRVALEEAIGEAVEALRDAVRVGLGLEEALRALARTGPAALRPAFGELERDLRLSGLDDALERARDRVADPLFDTLAIALRTAYEVGGRNLGAVLDGLARSVRGSVLARREARARQAQNVLSARVIAGLPVVLLVAIRLTNPDYLAPFATPSGQAVLALSLASVVGGYAAMLRASALPVPGRSGR